MDIAALSMSLASANVMQQASLAVTKKSMDVTETQMQGLLEMMNSTPAPSFGHKLDIRA